MISPAETITYLFSGVVVSNIYLIIMHLTPIPRIIRCLPFGQAYVLALQAMVAACIVRMQCIILNQPFQLRSRKIKVLLFLYAIFPMPILVVWVDTNVLPRACGCRCWS
ncbi:uncharacterized protein AKAW2_11431A [Aspergillus luchuensis]|uniref:Uncharacterized protein n=1 Tax=Aspergillus kawachii TaxID=1069201 RepID=A0A7R7ZTR6_ASPKA|nr:uncharacterized protein AKAW2_11431A [Aspergillus luchuensis]BCR94385.1 hypothetical protein AKAW2_11431A [Aspergillus luchuensis]